MLETKPEVFGFKKKRQWGDRHQKNTSTPASRYSSYHWRTAAAFAHVT